MTPRVRAIRVARAESNPLSVKSEAELVARVRLDEQPDPTGQIVRCGSAWEYILADGSPSGLASAQSRQDLERQIVLFHLGTVPSDESGDASDDGATPPYRIAI